MELGIIGMQNKNVALETGSGFLPQPPGLNVCRLRPQIRHHLNLVPGQSRCPRPAGRRRRGSISAMLQKRGPFCCPEGLSPSGVPSRDQQPCPPPITPQHPHHPHSGVKNWVMRMLPPQLCPWPPLSDMPCSSTGELFCLLSPKRALFSPNAHATPLNIPGTKGGNFSEGFQRGPSPPRPRGGGWGELGPGAEQPRGSWGSPGV